MLAYFIISLSGSIFAQENLSCPRFLSSITIDFPIADIFPSTNKNPK